MTKAIEGKKVFVLADTLGGIYHSGDGREQRISLLSYEPSSITYRIEETETDIHLCIQNV